MQAQMYIMTGLVDYLFKIILWAFCPKNYEYGFDILPTHIIYDGNLDKYMNPQNYGSWCAVYAHNISRSSNRQCQAKVETRPGHPGATHGTWQKWWSKDYFGGGGGKFPSGPTTHSPRDRNLIEPPSFSLCQEGNGSCITTQNILFVIYTASFLHLI